MIVSYFTETVIEDIFHIFDLKKTNLILGIGVSVQTEASYQFWDFSQRGRGEGLLGPKFKDFSFGPILGTFGYISCT